MGRLIKYYFVGFAVGFILFFLGFLFALDGEDGDFDVEEAAVMAVVAGGVYGLFCAGFMTRLMKTQVLLITPSNKDPQKGMQWYYEEIRQQIREMRFKKVGTNASFEVFHPQGFRKVWEGRIELSSDAYEVKVKASRIMIRILSDLVEISPVKEEE